MTIRAIRASVKKNQHHSLADYISDWKLIFTNARSYNIETSDIYEDACVMEKVFNETITRLADELYLELPDDITLSLD
jgi:hypothetical protein